MERKFEYKGRLVKTVSLMIKVGVTFRATEYDAKNNVYDLTKDSRYGKN